MMKGLPGSTNNNDEMRCHTYMPNKRASVETFGV